MIFQFAILVYQMVSHVAGEIMDIDLYSGLIVILAIWYILVASTVQRLIVSLMILNDTDTIVLLGYDIYIYIN